jgi:hypothetical protein
MTTTFEFFEGPKSEAQEPQVTVRKSGQMVLTPPAVAMLGDEVTHVQFGYDPDTGAVALRGAPEGAKGRYRLREQSNGSSLVDGRRFLAHHGLKVEKARRFPAEELGDGMVGFRLNGERSEGATEDKGQAAKGKSTRSTKRKAAATA